MVSSDVGPPSVLDSLAPRWVLHKVMIWTLAPDFSFGSSFSSLERGECSSTCPGVSRRGLSLSWRSGFHPRTHPEVGSGLRDLGVGPCILNALYLCTVCIRLLSWCTCAGCNYKVILLPFAQVHRPRAGSLHVRSLERTC